ncbi:hypothetical protein V6N13_140668 [Hibiscus sabdariffa]
MDPFYSDEANDVTNGETRTENVTPPEATEIPTGGEASPSTYSPTTHEADSPQVTSTPVRFRSLADIYANTKEVVGIEEKENEVMMVVSEEPTCYQEAATEALWNEQDGAIYVGALLFGMVINMFNSFSELSMMINRLPMLYKQRDLLFHPAWTFTLPSFLLKVPISILESVVWMAITYYTIGYAPEASKFFKQFLLVFLTQQMAAGFFRLIAGLCRTMVIANTGGALTLLLVFLLGGFIVPKREIPNWLEWAY